MTDKEIKQMPLEVIMHQIRDTDTQLKELRDRRKKLGKNAFKLMKETKVEDTNKQWRMVRKEDVDVSPILTGEI